MGRLAVDDRRRATPGSPETDAVADIPDPRRSIGKAAEADHPRHEAQRLLPRCREGARIRIDRPDHLTVIVLQRTICPRAGELTQTTSRAATGRRLAIGAEPMGGGTH